MTSTSSLFVRMAGRAAAVVLLVAGIASSATAQANLSTQGFGFPTGQFSSRAWGTGGATAEIDPLSPLNPATLAQNATRVITFQIEPEYRTVKSPSGTEHTSTARYPNVMGVIPVGSRFVFSLGASTLLDRTSSTQFTSTQVLSTGDSIPMTTNYHVDGAMADVRLGAAWTLSQHIHVGVGAHAITGHNLIVIGQSFADSAEFAPFAQTLTIGFKGAAASAGVQVFGKGLTLGAAYRAGFPITASVFDTALSRARVPDHFGVTLAYTGLANSALAIRTAHDNWSSLGNLGESGLKGVDAWDSSVGVDIAGPRSGNRVLFLRTGFRTRTLPFQAEGHDVKENSVTGGLGTSFANGHVLTDFAAIYANRTADIAASERAWTFSIGITVRP